MFFYDQESLILPYGDIEHSISEALYGRFSQKVSPEQPITVLNGPGSFTNIRIGTLALNTYTMLHNFAFQFHSIDKIQRYCAAHKIGLVPQYGIIYIGQKHYYWLVDFAKEYNQALWLLHRRLISI